MSEAMKRIGVIGLGYVGLPLALEFGKNMKLSDLMSIKAEFKILYWVKIEI